MKTDHDHESLELLIAAAALDGLDDGELLELEELRAEHGANCPECRRLESEYAEVAERLALALDPLPVPEGMEDLVAGLATGSVSMLKPGPDRRDRGIVWGPRDHVKGWVASAAAAIALLVGALGGYLAANAGDGTSGEVVAFVADSDTRIARFSGPGEGSLAVAFQPGERTTFLLGTGLAEAPEGRDYQVWMIQEGRPVSAGTFEPDRGSVVLEIPTDPSGSEAMAVTIERDGGVDQPQGRVVYETAIET